MKVLTGVLLVCFPLLTHAQFTYTFDQTIPVANTDNTSISLPWTGGLNSAQYSTIDINGDGTEDVVIFDRYADKLMTFINDNGSYQYAPDYELLFPETTRWVLLRDFNCDGLKDIFTGDAFGIKVYQNTTQPGEPLSWQQFLFYAPGQQQKSTVLLTKGFTSKINLQLQFDDLPSITDMDGDGDLDILSMQYSSEPKIEFHKNFSVERYGTCDSLDFERITQSWGDFAECGCGNFAFNGTSCPSSGGRVKHASGKAILAIDIDNDQDIDILFSEAECTKLFLLENHGDITTPSFSTAEEFPSQNPVDLTIFPAPFYEDVDLDGIKDIIVAPNLYTKTSFDTDLKASNWFYKNIGTTALPTLSFVKNNFLQNNMIDVGDNSVPAFADVDGDGDLDMFVGQNASQYYYGAVYYYENVGTDNAPSFKFITDNYLNIRSLFFYNIKPQFADFNNDGKTDLILSATSFITGQTKLYVLFNKSKNKMDFSGTTFTEISFSMLFNENLHITDVDLDGLSDILIGRTTGVIEFWKNVGSKNSPSFSLSNSNFLNIGPDIDLQNMSISSGDLNDDGKAELVIGALYGRMDIIANYREASTPPAQISDIIFNPFSDIYTNKNLGGRIWPTVANLYHTKKPTITFGNVQGGVQILRHTDETPLPKEPSIYIFPNPVSTTDVLNIKTDQPASVQLISLLGQELTTPVLIEPFQIYPVTLPKVSAGLYLLRFVINNKSYARRIVLY